MKCLTVYQPYASLIAIGAKLFETRGRRILYRGPLAIHAGLKKPSDVLDGVDIDIIFAMGRAFGVKEKQVGKITEYLETLPRGAVIATADLIGCWNTYGRTEIISCGDLRGSQPERINHFVCNDELLFGNFSRGRFAFELENMKSLPLPIPAKGKQGLWNWER